MRKTLLGLLLFFSVVNSAQDSIKKSSDAVLPLHNFLSMLEERFNITFSYNPRLVKGAITKKGLANSSLDEILIYLKNQFSISVIKIESKSFVLRSQNASVFCGYIKEESSGKPIEGATITDLNKMYGVIADSIGYFELLRQKKIDTLAISYLGFEVKLLPKSEFDSYDCPIFFLKERNYQLNEVIVNDYLVAGILKEQDGSISINPNNLEILSGLAEPDVLQNAQLLPGIESPNETAAGLFIRGGTPDQNLILWDGIKMYNTDHFFGSFSMFNPYSLEQVKVSRGGTSANYGDRVSGVVDMKTSDYIPDKMTGGFGINFISADGFLNFPISKKVGIQISGRRALTDFIKTVTFNNFSSKVFQNTSLDESFNSFEPQFTNSTEKFYFWDTHVKLNAKPSDKDKITASAIITQNSLDYSFADVDFIDNIFDRMNIQNLGFSGSWKHIMSNEFKTQISTYYSDYSFKYDGLRENDVEAFSVKKNNKLKELGLSVNADWKINNQLSFLNGYQFFNTRVNYFLGDSFFEERGFGTINSHAFFHQLKYGPKQWQIELGLRNAYYTTLATWLFEPRILVEKEIFENFRIKASGEIKNQSISQIIEYTTQDFGLDNQVWAQADREDIPALQSRQFSTGVFWHKNTWRFDLDLYHKKIDGLTSLTRGFQTAQNILTNGESITNGIDVLIKKGFGNYSTWLGYTYSFTDFYFNSLNAGIPFSGNNDIRHSLIWSHSYKLRNLQFSLGWRYRTGIPYTNAELITGENGEVEIGFIDLNQDTLNNYHRMDISALYDIRFSKSKIGRKLRLGISLVNLYGRQNELSKSFSLGVFKDENNMEQFELLETTRYSIKFTPNFVMRFNF